MLITVIGAFFVPPYVAAAGGSVKLRRRPAPGATGDLTLSNVSLEEAASIAAVHVIPSSGGAAVTAATFAKTVQLITTAPAPGCETTRINATRHEWVVFGGMDFGGGYVGFLQQALALSGFS